MLGIAVARSQSCAKPKSGRSLEPVFATQLLKAADNELFMNGRFARNLRELNALQVPKDDGTDSLHPDPGNAIAKRRRKKVEHWPKSSTQRDILPSFRMIRTKRKPRKKNGSGSLHFFLFCGAATTFHLPFNLL